jgi:hydroxymethylglutaryl-CoA lyase
LTRKYIDAIEMGMQTIQIVEVAPRDGLQNETATVPTEAKVAFVDALSLTGVSEIEVSAFVSPRRVPQLGDAADVFRRIDRSGGIVYSALVPNEQGLERAIEAGVDKISVFTAVSETFNRKNINTTLEGSLRRFRPMVERAKAEGLPVRGYVSTAFWCAFEGKVSPKATVSVVEKLFEVGVDEVSISDTIGKAAPDEVTDVLDLLLPKIPADRIAVHFHDTYGKGLDNVIASWSRGVRTFDASTGGIGGCPFAPGATGNVATEAVVKVLRDRGETVSVDLEKLSRARRLLDEFLKEERRILPDEEFYACSVCEFHQGDDCCWRQRAQQ